MRAQQARPPPSLRSTRTAGLPALGCWRWLRSIQLCLRWLAPTLLVAGAALTLTSPPLALVYLAARSQYYEPTIAKRLARDVMRVTGAAGRAGVGLRLFNAIPVEKVRR